MSGPPDNKPLAAPGVKPPAEIKRIKDNLYKILTGGGTEQEADAYLQAEGVTVDEIKNSPVARTGQITGATPEMRAYNPTPTQRMGDQTIARHKGTKAPSLPDNASIWTRAVDWMNSFGDATDAAAHGMTGGLTDEAAGLGRGVGAMAKTGDPSQFVPGFTAGMDATNANLARYRQQNPFLASTLEGMGLFTSPLMRLGQGWQSGGATPIARATRSAITGAGTGAATAAAYDEGDIASRMRAAGSGAAAGGALGFAVPLAIEGVAKKPAVPSAAAQTAAAKKAPAPSIDDIKAAAKSEYQKASAADAILAPTAIQNLQQSVQKELSGMAYHPGLQPKVKIILDELDRVSQGNISADGVDTLRKLALNVAQSPDPSERMMGGLVVGKIDDLMENLTPADIVQGNATQAAESLTRARDLWKTFRKAELVDNTVKEAITKAKTQNSGGNIQNTIRQDLRRIILQNPKNARSFTAEELKVLKRIADGTPWQNITREIGRLAPSSSIAIWGPIFTGLGVGGYAAANIPGALGGLAIPAIGAGAKELGTRSTKKAADALSSMIRQKATQAAPQLSQVPTFPMQVRQQFINQMIRERLGLAGNSAAGAVGGLVGAKQ